MAASMALTEQLLNNQNKKAEFSSEFQLTTALLTTKIIDEIFEK